MNRLFFLLCGLLMVGCFDKPEEAPPKNAIIAVPPEVVKLAPPAWPKALPVNAPAQPLETPRVITTPPTPTPRPKATPSPTPAQKAKPLVRVSGTQIVAKAKQYVGTVEQPGNRGPQIDKWNRQAGVPLGSPYCGSFAGAMHIEAGATPPKGYAWTPSWFSQNLVSYDQAQPGDVVGFYYPAKKRIAHIGILEKKGTPYTAMIEANTSYDAKAGSASDREGDGVHAKLRNTKILTQEKNKFARYW